MDASLVAVATITWARTPAEEEQLRRSLERLAEAGLPVAVADAGTNSDFGGFLSHLPGFHVTVPPARGLVAQVAASLALAAGLDRPCILYTEPDKALFFGPRMTDFLQRAADDRQGRQIGVVLASRSGKSFETFPSMQRYTEGVINELCGDLLGSPGDFSYGPFLMTCTLVPELLGVRRDLGWGWRHFAFRAARRAGLPVEHVTGDYPCPPDQRVEDHDERVHRLRQLSENILGLIEPHVGTPDGSG
jgi:hypothetical protein